MKSVSLDSNKHVPTGADSRGLGRYRSSPSFTHITIGKRSRLRGETHISEKRACRLIHMDCHTRGEKLYKESHVRALPGYACGMGVGWTGRIPL